MTDIIPGNSLDLNIIAYLIITVLFFVGIPVLWFFFIKYENNKTKSKILKERYAKGEITKEEYDHIKKI